MMDRSLHDMRNDLAVAIGTLHALIDGRLPTEISRLQTILSSLESLDDALGTPAAVATVTAKEHLLNAVIEGSPYAKILVNAAGKIVLVNAQTEALFGYTRAELLGESIERLVPERFRHGHPALRSHFTDAPVAREMGAGRDLYGLRKDASEMPIEIGLNPISTGSETFTLAAVTDITERRRAEALRLAHAGMQQYTAELEALNNELEFASRFKTEFVATMSHELRTPLSAIVGAAELLERAPLDAPERRIVHTIAEASEALLSIVKNVLDFSKIEAGKLELEIAPFELAAVIDGAAEVVAQTARANRTTLNVFVDPALPAVIGDRDRLRQVLLNLLGNAVKFTAGGHITARASIVEETAQIVTVRFEVEDDGIGIAPDVVPTLFEPFAQADRSASRRFGGTGLGLSISKRLVELMDGTIGARSEPGAGSTFWFVIPFARAPVAAERRSFDAIRALIVTADDTFAGILTRYLEGWSIPVVRSAGGAGLERAISGDGWLACVDLDESGSADGRAVADRIAQAGVPVIGIGGDGLLRKPVGQSLLLDAIAGAIGMHAAPAARERVKSPATASNGVILVAEDNDQLAQLLQLQFDQLEIRAAFVSDGRQAVEAVKRTRYAMILMDCQMPDIDGLEATRMIRETESRDGGHIPIAAMTANAFAEDRTACMQAGMDDYLAKPVKLAELRAMIERWTKKPA
jgi:two-component system sensor histidine kinase/response regulator